MLTIRKRGRFYHCRGTIRVGKETRQVKEHSTGQDQKRAAQEYTDTLTGEIRRQILHGSSGRAGGLTFTDACALYLDRPGGLHKADVWRLGHVLDAIGDAPLNTIREAWGRFVATQCAGLKPSTVMRYRATAQAAINHLADAKEFDVARLPTLAVKSKRLRYLSGPEQERLLEAYAPHVMPIMLTLCFQGCRSQEALRLRWTNVDFARGTLHFPLTKTGEPRTVAMHARAREAIERLHVERGNVEPDGHVFLNRFGRPYSSPNDYAIPGGNPLSRAHETACRRAGIEDFRVHDWRHHWASMCVMAGVDLETIRRMGGWKSLRMLEHYATISVEHMHEAMAKLA